MPIPMVPPPSIPPTGNALLDLFLGHVRKDPFGGEGGGTGIVTNTGSQSARALSKYLPTFYRALQRAPNEMTFVEGGVPTAAKAATRAIPGSSNVSIHLRENLPDDLESLVHEGLHGLYASKRGSMIPPSGSGNRILEALASPPVAQSLRGVYDEPEHAALAAMAKQVLVRGGLLPSQFLRGRGW